MERVSFSNQVAIVTGAGRGLGRAYALELARRDAQVVVNDINEDSAQEVVAEITEEGGRAVASFASVSSADGARQLASETVESFGAADAVISNAGILRSGHFESLSVEAIEDVLDVNLLGPIFLAQAVWGAMKERGYGRLVLTSSATGLFSRGGSVNYGAAKAGIYGLCRSLAAEGKEHGIKVNALLPRATTKIIDADTIPGFLDQGTAAMKEAFAARNEPEFTAPIAAYLASSACTVTGEAYSSVFGRYARAFVGLTRGWLGTDPVQTTAEDVLVNLAAIRSREGYTVPARNFDEEIGIAEMLGIETP